MRESPRLKLEHLVWAALALYVFPLGNGLINPFLMRFPSLFWLFDFAGYVGLPLLVFGFLFVVSGLRPEHIGLRKPTNSAQWIKLLLHTLVFSCAFVFVADHLIEFFHTFIPSEAFFSYAWMIPTRLWSRVLITLYFGVTAGVIEEVYYRGLLMKLCSEYRFPKVFTLGLVSVLFALAHWEGGIESILSSFVIGLFVAAYYSWSGLLLPAVVAHFVFDWMFFFRYSAGG